MATKRATATKSEQVIDLVKGMTLLEVVDLNKLIKDKFGISAISRMVAPAPVQPVQAEPVEEQTEFSVRLESFGANKIEVVKTMRTFTTLGLKEAKDLVESAPVEVKSGATKEEAETIREKLVAAGATVTVS